MYTQTLRNNDPRYVASLLLCAAELATKELAATGAGASGRGGLKEILKYMHLANKHSYSYSYSYSYISVSLYMYMYVCMCIYIHIYIYIYYEARRAMGRPRGVAMRVSSSGVARGDRIVAMPSWVQSLGDVLMLLF